GERGDGDLHLGVAQLGISGELTDEGDVVAGSHVNSSFVSVTSLALCHMAATPGSRGGHLPHTWEVGGPHLSRDSPGQRTRVGLTAGVSYEVVTGLMAPEGIASAIVCSCRCQLRVSITTQRSRPDATSTGRRPAAARSARRRRTAAGTISDPVSVSTRRNEPAPSPDAEASRRGRATANLSPVAWDSSLRSWVHGPLAATSDKSRASPAPSAGSGRAARVARLLGRSWGAEVDPPPSGATPPLVPDA